MEESKSKDGGPGGVRSLTRGLEILACFDEANFSLTLSEISEKTNLSVSTVSRLLQTLVQTGYLSRDAQKQYILGSKVYNLVKAISNNSSNLRTAAMPILENLRDIFDETASLYVVRDDMRVCLASVQSYQPLRRLVEVGETLPLARGAAGYVLLSWSPFPKRQRIIKEHPYLNEGMLSDIRKTGYVINDGLQEPGVFAIAAPVFNAQGENLAAIAVSGPSYRIGEAVRRELINAIKLYSGLISKALGFENK